ncbi:MAG: hypothetical protein HWN67_07100, partial [Candidatus Helarchaeota archaeon]|nr:hypothetical protein [Candidatus Helarchaeota archaeon]
ISPSEERFIQKDINSKFGSKIYEKVKNNYQLIVAEGKWKSIFLVPPQIIEIFNKIKGKDTPIFIGIHFGDLLKNQFKIQIAALELISDYTKKYVILTGKGEQTALYGRNIPLALIKKVEPRIKKDEFVIVRNELKESIALGKFLIDSENLSKITNRNKIIIKIIMDLGEYLRKER